MGLMMGRLKDAMGPEARPVPFPAPKQCPALSPARSPKRRPKPVRLALLYPEHSVDPQAQAQALLYEIQAHAEDCVGAYVPQSHLKRFYEELAEHKGWEVQHWSVLGAELRRLTDKKLIKRRGKRFVTYKIPHCMIDVQELRRQRTHADR